MPLPRKQKPRRKPFVVTVAQAAATVALLPGCFSTVTSNPPYVEDPQCPDQEPTTGAPCSDVIACSYEVDYGCGPQTNTASCDGTTWSVNWGGPSCNPPPPPPTCPTEAPTWGAPCSEVITCSYEIDQGCGPQPATATCDGASWSISPQVSCNPPPPDYCVTYTTEAACGQDASCRWLVPGCGEPPLPQAGCFAAVDCGGDFDCQISGGTCQEVVINPCHNLACDACGMTVSVCVPPAAP
jgi:hypothetical protein